MVNSLISFSKIRFTLDIKEELYYNDVQFKYDSFWNEVIKENKRSIKNMLKNHKNFNSWLDLGCGNGKNIKLLPKYKTYYGIDFDVNQLIKCIEKFNGKNNIFNYLDLSKDWNIRNDKWLQFDIVKYDNILAINSIMHFCNDIFWKQIDSVAKKGTVFTFNVLNENINAIYNGKWERNNSYLTKVDNNINYQFNNVHKSKNTENYISKDILLGYLRKHNWEIINEFTNDKNELTNLYTWYSVTKN